MRSIYVVTHNVRPDNVSPRAHASKRSNYQSIFFIYFIEEMEYDEILKSEKKTPAFIIKWIITTENTTENTI